MLNIVVLLNHNDGEDIIRSVKKLTGFGSVSKIIVVDNGSTDSSLTQIKKFKTRKLLIVENKENLGFGRGCNVGIKLALALGADNVANLNPDLDYSFDFIKPLSQSGLDIVAPVLKTKQNGKYVYDFGGKINWFLGRAYHLVSSKAKSTTFNTQPDLGPQRSEDRSRECDYASGGAIMVKRKVFDEIGFFDERFFIYYEDADFSIRAKKAGFSVGVDKDVVIEHLLEEVKVTHNRVKINNNLISNFKFIVKWVPWYFKPIAMLYLLWLWSKIS